MNWLGLDIGGANLKAADGRGWARNVPFALWRDSAGLAGAIEQLVQSAPSGENIAVTMTGELCDCFRTKADGARHILTAVEQAAGGRDVLVYLVDGRFVALQEASSLTDLAAASNWHAIARFASRYVEGGAGLLIDVGSTTTDIVPIVAGWPATKSVSDTDRLLAGELVYTGVGRTPVCAVTRTLAWRGEPCPVAAELFATTADAYVLLGDLTEDASNQSAADGRPLTREYCLERLARMVCADGTTCDGAQGRRMAEEIRKAQLNTLRAALVRVVCGMAEPPRTCVLSGAGEFLASAVAAELPGARQVSLATELGATVSSAAAAHAVSNLAVDLP